MSFTQFALSTTQVKADLKAFEKLLAKPSLNELQDILPFFKLRPHLCGFMGTYNLNIIDWMKINTCNEFSVFGDHRADLAVGDLTNHEYCFIEFEDATSTSVFKKKGKLTPEWSNRFEHGFSQIVDWINWIEDAKNTQAFHTRFNTGTISYNMMLVLGRDQYLANQGLRQRLKWWTDYVSVHGRQVHCITFDKLYEQLSQRIELFNL